MDSVAVPVKNRKDGFEGCRSESHLSGHAGERARRDQVGQLQQTDVLGVEIPYVPIPIVPGKNITVIAEVVALNYLTRAYGYNPAEKLNRHLLEMMKRKSQNRAWVREDME